MLALIDVQVLFVCLAARRSTKATAQTLDQLKELGAVLFARDAIENEVQSI
jgi:hypothetical protein